jgi:hypothetical protein
MIRAAAVVGPSAAGRPGRGKIEIRLNDGRYENKEHDCGYVAAKLAVREVGRLVISSPPDADLPVLGVS